MRFEWAPRAGRRPARELRLRDKACRRLAHGSHHGGLGLTSGGPSHADERIRERLGEMSSPRRPGADLGQRILAGPGVGSAENQTANGWPCPRTTLTQTVNRV